MVESLARVFATHGVVVPQTRWSAAPPAPKKPDNTQDGGSGFPPEAYRLQLSPASIRASGNTTAQAPDAAANPPPSEPPADAVNGNEEENGNEASAVPISSVQAYGNPPAATGGRLNLLAA